jgi:hypothetical protein
MQPRLYGVSYGNGNDGVSHLFADFYVRTDDPWRLAKLAMITQFKDKWQAAALEACEVDGEAEYTVTAVIYEPLDAEPCDEGESWCDHNGAVHLVDVFPEDEPREGRPTYESLEEAFGDDVVKVAA